MSHRYRAPEHCSGILCPSGNEYRANKAGIIEIPAEAPEGDHAAALGLKFALESAPATDDAAAAESGGKASPKA